MLLVSVKKKKKNDDAVFYLLPEQINANFAADIRLQ